MFSDPGVEVGLQSGIYIFSFPYLYFLIFQQWIHIIFTENHQKIGPFIWTNRFTDGVSDGEESARNAGDPGLIPGEGTIPWRKEWQPTLVFLPEEYHG